MTIQKYNRGRGNNRKKIIDLKKNVIKRENKPKLREASDKSKIKHWKEYKGKIPSQMTHVHEKN